MFLILLLVNFSYLYFHRHLKLFDSYVFVFLILFHIADCSKMAALPQGAFAACKLRELNDRDLLIARIKSNTDKNETKNINTNKKCELETFYVNQ